MADESSTEIPQKKNRCQAKAAYKESSVSIAVTKTILDFLSM